MIHVIARVGLYIGLIAQGCLVGNALAITLDKPQTQEQSIDFSVKKQNAIYAERVIPGYIERQLQQILHSADAFSPYTEPGQYSSRPTAPVEEWRDWRHANPPDQKERRVRYYENSPPSDYGESYNDAASITVEETLRLYMNGVGGEPAQGQRGAPRQGGSLELMKHLLNLTLNEEQTEQLLAITEPWQDESGTRHFSIFGMGDFVMESTPASTHAAGHAAPGVAYQMARTHQQPAATGQGGQTHSAAAPLTLKEYLYKFIEDTIGWPMLYLLAAAISLLVLAISIFRFITTFSIGR
ncbi:MAG: hypothetical protein L3J26_10765 [Candidatus Polarisedimenticolaceae bacterium]|nr:hypothetical protein [Candidatus Polarisedimenticolaceae bacterium]